MLRRSPFVVCVVILLSCDDESTRHVVEIGDAAIVSTDQPLCRGDIVEIEQAIMHAREILDVAPSDLIPIHIYDRYADVDASCPSGASGCYSEGEVHSLWQSVEHEIVHAVDAPLGSVPLFWNEGIAEAISGRTSRGATDIASNLEITESGELDYRSAGHFVRWLLEVHGAAELRRLARGESFSEAYGLDLDVAIADYETDAPWSYPHWNPCRGERIAPVSPGSWVSRIEIDCDAASSTTRNSWGVGATRTIDIEEPGTYRLVLDGGVSIGLVACQLGVLDLAPTSDLAGDIIREDSETIPPLPSMFLSNEAHQLQLEPGRIQLGFSTEEGVTTGSLGFELVRIEP